MQTQQIIATLKEELALTLGCTDPVTVALTAARAAQALGRSPDRVRMQVSPNILKNAGAVGVPGTKERGIHIAAALGAVLGNGENGLALLKDVTEADVAAAKALLAQNTVTVTCAADAPDVLYLRADVAAGTETAHAIIAGDYDNIIEVGRNGIADFSRPLTNDAQTSTAWDGITFEALFRTLSAAPVAALAFIDEAAAINRQAATRALETPTLTLSAALSRNIATLPAPYNAIHQARALVGAAAEARMVGLSVPVMAVAGSGNQGIASSLSVVGVAEIRHSPAALRTRAIALSMATTALMKSHAARMTSYCGGAIAGAAGAAAGVTLLLGGDAADAAHAVQSTVGVFACLLCDGAKESCAHKIAYAVATGVEYAYLAREGAYLPPAVGVIGATVDATFANLGRLNNEGLVATERLMLDIIEQHGAHV